jgi:hypothetical protein
LRDSSRKLEDAHLELQKRWRWIVEEYKLLYPNEPPPQLSQTYRNEEDQLQDFLEGSSQVKYPNSTHNLYPSWALDYFFTEIVNGKPDTSYKPEWMNRVGVLAERLGLFWGKRWGFDVPHLALVEFVTQANDEALKKLPPIPEHENDIPTYRLFNRVTNEQTGLLIGRVVGDKIYYDLVEIKAS